MNRRGRIGDGASTKVVVSRNGGWVAFSSSATNLVPGGVRPGIRHIYVKNLRTGRIRLASVSTHGRPANDLSEGPAISRNGRWISYRSSADNLVPGVRSTDRIHAFVHDRVAVRTTLESVTADGEPLGANPPTQVSQDGRFIVLDVGSIGIVRRQRLP